MWFKSITFINFIEIPVLAQWVYQHSKAVQVCPTKKFNSKCSVIQQCNALAKQICESTQNTFYVICMLVYPI